MSMAKAKRGWRNPPKYIEKPEEGKCPYCNKHIKSLKDHIHDKHKLEKLIRKKNSLWLWKKEFPRNYVKEEMLMMKNISGLTG